MAAEILIERLVGEFCLLTKYDNIVGVFGVPIVHASRASADKETHTHTHVHTHTDVHTHACINIMTN